MDVKGCSTRLSVECTECVFVNFALRFVNVVNKLLEVDLVTTVAQKGDS